MKRRSIVIVAAVVVLLAGGLVAWRMMDGGDASARRGGNARAAKRIDVERFRTDFQARLERARRVAARQKVLREQRLAAGDAGARKPLRSSGRAMLEPECILGPAELCAILDEPVTDCDAGDAQACIAVGQYLADTPPRPMVAISFYLYACWNGDQDGCARLKASKEPGTFECEDDPLRCSWVALKDKDDARLDDACSLGVADACTFLNTRYETEGDIARGRAYLETACQHGSPLACNELGRRLMPGCEVIDGVPCYPPEPDEAAAARAIACEVGFAEACS